MTLEGGGGGTLSELYQRSKRLLLTTRDGLDRLKRLEFSSSNGDVDSPELCFIVKHDIELYPITLRRDGSPVAVHCRQIPTRFLEKRAQRKVLDVLNTVGVSNFVLKLIESWHRVDRLIKYVSMILTIIILIVFWRWK